MACLLFKICLELFLEQSDSVGRVIALDEAHKYMSESEDCKRFTEGLLTTIRLQRHQAARVFISTQEPTISHKLLDLCSITIVHRFSSPDWFRALGRHLAGLDETITTKKDATESESDGVSLQTPVGSKRSQWLFETIIALAPGQALIFAPSAIVSVGAEVEGQVLGTKRPMRRLGLGVLKVRIRKRLTKDGGASIMAS